MDEEEFHEMKLEYLAELDRLQGQDQGAAGNEASEEPGELRDLRGLQGDKGRQGRRGSLFHGRALHAGDGDGGVGALGTLAGSALDYDGEGLPDDPEAPDGGMGDDLLGPSWAPPRPPPKTRARQAAQCLKRKGIKM